MHGLFPLNFHVLLQTRARRSVLCNLIVSARCRIARPVTDPIDFIIRILKYYQWRRAIETIFRCKNIIECNSIQRKSEPKCIPCIRMCVYGIDIVDIKNYRINLHITSRTWIDIVIRSLRGIIHIHKVHNGEGVTDFEI